MAPKKQREYPRVNSIKDQDTQQTIKLLWDKAHDQTELHSTLETLVKSAQATISSHTTVIETLRKQLTQALAGGGIATASTVGGGGSGGSSGGSGSGTPGGGTPPPPPSPTDIPNQQGTVAQAKADLIAGGIDITTCTSGGPCCGPWQITNLAAFRLGGNYGLLSKDGGQNCNGFSTDIIAVKPSNGGTTMPIFDVLVGSDGPATPAWQFNSYVSTDRWRAPQTPPI
jgi:hypothetical protein